MRIQTFCSKRSVERLDKSIVRRLPSSGKSDPHCILICPQVHRLTGKFGSVVSVHRLMNPTGDFDPVQHPNYIFPKSRS
jgi:hypothetical protein